jgi:inner membrane protein
MLDFLEAVRRALRSPAFKFFLVCFLILLLLVPLLLVNALIWEREVRAQAVRGEVGRTWGPEQQVLGPFLVVPYTVRLQTVQGDKRIEQLQERRAVFTPEVLRVAGRAQSKTLHRSIFEIPVYSARLALSGRFAVPAMADVAADAVSVRWRDAVLVLGLSGVSGLKEAAVLKIAGAADVPFAPSVGFPAHSLNGIHAKLGAVVIPSSRRGHSTIPSISSSTAPSRSASPLSRARPRYRSPPIGRTPASSAASCPTTAR